MPRISIGRGGVTRAVMNSRQTDNDGRHEANNHELSTRTVQQQVTDIKAEITAINSLISRIPMAGTLASDIALALQADKKEGIAHYEEELLKLAKERIEKRGNLAKLFALIMFFALYALALILQHNGTKSFDLESSVLMSNVMASLPTNGAGASFFNGGAPGSTGLLSSNDDFYAWLGESIVGAMFKDSVCGDGVCNYPEEVKAVGRFGCAADCGKVASDTTVTIRVDLKTVMQWRFFDNVDLTDIDPGFRYNIFSKKFNDYVFEKHVEPSGLMVHTFEALRTDSLELHLFQINSLADIVDIRDIQLQYHFGDGTIPDRKTPVAWGYGDLREVLAASQYQLSKVQDYCLNRVGDLYSARTDDSVCSDATVPYPQGFPNYFTPLGMGLQILQSYGITGDITVPSVNEYGKKVLVSLVRPPGASKVGSAIKYCGPLPPANATVDTLPSSMDFVRMIEKTSADCSASLGEARRRRGGRHEPFERFQTLPPPVRQDLPKLEEEPLPTLEEDPLPKVEDGRNEASNDATPISARRTLLQSVTGSNPLGLRVDDVGTDDRGFWKCYTGPNDVKLNTKCWEANAQWYFDSYNSSNIYGYQGTLFAAVDVPYTTISAFQTDATLAAAVAAWRASSGQAPGLTSAGLQLRFSTDARSQVLDGPDCSGAFNPPDEIKVAEYDFKTRLRLWNTNATRLQAWLCNISTSQASTPTSSSTINISDTLAAMGFPPMARGPALNLNIPLKGQISDAIKQGVQDRLAKMIWPVPDERWKSRVWSTVISPSQSSPKWMLKIIFLSTSNSRATRASYLFSHEISSAAFLAAFPDVIIDPEAPIGTVQAPGPAVKLDQNSPYSCLSHYDCGEGLFCSTVSMTTAAQGFRGGGGPGPSGYGCDLCKYCVSDDTDPVDSWCPRDKCGPRTGSYPACVNASQMFSSDFQCRSKYPLYLDRVPAVPRTSHESEQIPLSNPNSTKSKARFLTPYNQLLGSMILTQRRRSGPCILKNDSVSTYSRLKEPKLGAVCRGWDIDTDPYGTDPAFIPSSSLFRGEFQATAFYRSTELSDDSALPYGFFPHSYDQKNGGPKSFTNIIASESESFKVYITERLTSVHAQRFITYLRDGGYIDQDTESVTIEIPTLNQNLNMFGIYTFHFNWEVGGKITWDYHISSIPIYMYEDHDMKGRMFLEIFLIVVLAINVLSELFDIVMAIKRFEFLDYIRSLWNVIDWVHFGLMCTGWSLWMKQVNMSNDLKVPVGLNILTNPAPETAARYLATDPEGEYVFLKFLSSLKAMDENLNLYNYITSICVLLFILRLLKVADFQPRIALVTRTLSNAVLDLMHFVTLYCTILLGYAITGMLLFGHQYEGYKNLSNSIFSLIIVMIAWDPSQWVQLNHSAPDWAFDIFIWSWIWIAVFILLNILLAILVEGYMGVKQLVEKDHAPGLLSDMAGVTLHELERLLRFVWRSYPFVSDDELVSMIEAKLGSQLQEQTSLNRAMRDHYLMKLAGMAPIYLPSGGCIDNGVVYDILSGLCPDRLVAAKKGIASDKFLDPNVRGIMSRYSSTRKTPNFDETLEQKLENFRELARLESLKKLAQLHLNALCPTADAFSDAPPAEIQIVTLHVTIERARNLPRMDLGKGVDVFCIIFLEGTLDIYRTEVRRGKSEADWTWASELSRDFTWDLPVDVRSLDPERQVVILVYDRDQVSQDDLIGSINVPLRDLTDGKLDGDGWRVIARPPGATSLLCGSSFWQASIPELKIAITLSAPASSPSPADLHCPTSDLARFEAASGGACTVDLVNTPQSLDKDLQLELEACLSPLPAPMVSNVSSSPGVTASDFSDDRTQARAAFGGEPGLPGSGIGRC